MFVMRRVEIAREDRAKKIKLFFYFLGIVVENINVSETNEIFLVFLVQS